MKDTPEIRNHYRNLLCQYFEKKEALAVKQLIADCRRTYGVAAMDFHTLAEEYGAEQGFILALAASNFGGMKREVSASDYSNRPASNESIYDYE